MAARVGTAREVVSRALRELESRGAISRQEPHAISVDAHALQALLFHIPDKQSG
jgi:DNA-binding GntR family transcriptional regulator